MIRVDLAELIATESAKFEALRGEVDRTVTHRDRDPRSRLEWEQACEAFHSFTSPIDPYVERACEDERYTDKDLLDFVVCFLEVDPWFFRSGYLKQIFLTRLKRSDLSAVAKRRLRTVLLDAVERRGTREFKYYCRLAIAIADQGLVSALEVASAKANGAISNRAKLMLETIRQTEAWRVPSA